MYKRPDSSFKIDTQLKLIFNALNIKNNNSLDIPGIISYLKTYLIDTEVELFLDIIQEIHIKIEEKKEVNKNEVSN